MLSFCSGQIGEKTLSKKEQMIIVRGMSIIEKIMFN